MKRTQQGFTLIELMIVVAIIGILAAIALPAYQNYTARAKFSEVVASVSGLKTAVELCALDRGALTACSNGANGPGYTITNLGASGKVQSVAVAGAGVITATAIAGEGLASRTYIMTPTLAASGQVTWAVGGTCRTASPQLC
ncbi:MAG: prepilin-type N-terminal cleavage/methylation domain-containing protein [Alishewanella aestuarii]